MIFIGVIIGFIVGLITGIVITSICSAAKRDDEMSEKYYQLKDGENER